MAPKFITATSYQNLARLCTLTAADYVATLISGGSRRGHFRHMPPLLVWPLIRITVVHDSLQVSCRLAKHQVGAVSLKRVWLGKVGVAE